MITFSILRHIKTALMINSSKLKKKFKHEMIDVILGKKIRRGRRKKLNN